MRKIIKLGRKNKIYTCGMDCILKNFHDYLLEHIDEYIPLEVWDKVELHLQKIIYNIQKTTQCPFRKEELGWKESE